MRRFALALALAHRLAGVFGLMLNATDATRDDPHHRPAEATLRIARTAANAYGGETFTVSCASVPFIRGMQGERNRFWTPREITNHEQGGDEPAYQNRWFNGREAAYGDIFDWVLDRADPAAAVVYDVGSHTGWYATLSAVRGFHTDAFEMQPECGRRIRCASHVNRVSARVDVYTVHVTDRDDDDDDDGGGRGGFLPVTAVTCFSGLSAAWERNFRYTGVKERVPPLHLGRHIVESHAATGKRVGIMKVDIEGGEVVVARSLAAVPASLRLVDHIVAEYSPHMWGDLNITTDEGIAAFGPWFDAGFVAVDVPENRRIEPGAWRAAPETPAAPRHGLPTGSVLRDVPGLRRYTQWALETLGGGFHVFTLWFFRTDGELEIAVPMAAPAARYWRPARTV